MKTTADRLKYARDKLSWTQAKLAVIAGVSTGTIGNIESGARQSKGSLPQIAEALGVNHKWLSTGQGEPDSYPLDYKPNQPPARMERAQAATDLGAVIDGLREHMRAAGDNKEAVAGLLSALAKDPDNERVASALHTMLDLGFVQANQKSAQSL